MFLQLLAVLAIFSLGWSIGFTRGAQWMYDYKEMMK